MRHFVCAAAAACILLSGCGGKKRAKLPNAPHIGGTETGVASWYGHPYHGRHAANGEIYDMEKMTAAHRTLPFGTWVRVRNLENNKTVDVRITDRGPFVGGRILDLSHAAAASIDMIGPGLAKVKITVIRAQEAVLARQEIAAATQPAPPPLPPPAVTPPITPVAADRFAVQVGAFSDKRNAERVRSAMERAYGRAVIVMRDARPVQWRVLVGREETEGGAEALAARIRSDPAAQAGSAFVVRLDNETGADSI
jgi:rare lipoprotein A